MSTIEQTKAIEGAGVSYALEVEGDSGYHTHFTGAWVCYSCGVLCECGGE